MKQKYITEVLSAMITCKSYNLEEEIFRNLCIIVCSKVETSAVQTAKEDIIRLTERELVMTMADEIKYKFKYDIINQPEVDVMTPLQKIF